MDSSFIIEGPGSDMKGYRPSMKGFSASFARYSVLPFISYTPQNVRPLFQEMLLSDPMALWYR